MTMPDNNSESRRHTRHSALRQFSVFDNNSAVTMGTLVNISLEGYMLLGEYEASEGKVYEARIESEGINITLEAECLWVNEADSENKFWSGFHIDNLDESKSIDVLQLIKAVSARDS